MRRYLFTVSYVGLLKGRGVLLCPGVSLKDYDLLKTGDRIELRSPNGGTIVTEIAAMEYPPSVISVGTPLPAENRASAVLLPAHVRRDEVALGTEVWTADDVPRNE